MKRDSLWVFKLFYSSNTFTSLLKMQVIKKKKKKTSGHLPHPCPPLDPAVQRQPSVLFALVSTSLLFINK